ncbi:hypothetical protein [Streptomyces sp. NBC_00233]|uniref:hypothetical protein n=1 Tax=Streptomyces sp. NBC_00233 TaxID=2975686 RepID=UPI0022500CC4|nr:hypothetical protein [Streptomyces sp. NBC_00233]MCX5233505.1 hypothetical protein [Streptomyces sp. NBC_00233]
MSTARRRALGLGPAVPEAAARDPRALTAAAGDWTAQPATAPAPLEPRPARRRLGGGPADPGAAPIP